MYTPPKRMAGQGSDREARLFQILAFLLWNEYECNGEGVEPKKVTTYQVAKGIGMSPSQHLRGLLNELSRKGYLDYSEGVARNGVLRAEWCLSENLYSHPKVHEIYEHARHISEAQRHEALQ